MRQTISQRWAIALGGATLTAVGGSDATTALGVAGFRLETGTTDGTERPWPKEKRRNPLCFMCEVVGYGAASHTAVTTEFALKEKIQRAQIRRSCRIRRVFYVELALQIGEEGKCTNQKKTVR
jgi:hypothetical protein